MKALKPTCIFSLALLTACAPPKPLMGPDGTILQQGTASIVPQQGETPDASTGAQGATSAAATTVSSWDISGAMAARSKAKSWSAALNWQQQGINNYRISLSGPLGGGTVLIERQGGMVTFRDGPKSASSNSADDLLQKQTGIRLPVNNLYYWVRGLPAPGSAQGVERDNANHLIRLQQAGYSINYIGYTTVGNVALPSKIQLQGHGVAIKLVIKRWNI